MLLRGIHAHATDLGPLSSPCNFPEPAKASLQVEMWPKRDDIAMLVIISLGYDSTNTVPSQHSRQLNRKLPVRYSGSEDKIDRKLFR